MTKGDIYVEIHSQKMTTVLPNFIEFDSISGGLVYFHKMHKKLIPINFSHSRIVPNGLPGKQLQNMTEDEFRDYELYDENRQIITITNHTIHKD